MVFAATALNHIELVHRPGEQELAAGLFGLFGCETWTSASGWLVVEDNIWISEVTPEQWAYEQELAPTLTSTGVTPARDAFLRSLQREPQRHHHFGFGYRTENRFEAAVGRVREASASGPLAGRVELASVFRPGDPGSVGGHIMQAFVRTDIVADGLLVLGQAFELQHYFVNDSRRPRG